VCSALEVPKPKEGKPVLLVEVVLEGVGYIPPKPCRYERQGKRETVKLRILRKLSNEIQLPIVRRSLGDSSTLLLCRSSSLLGSSYRTIEKGNSFPSKALLLVGIVAGLEVFSEVK
jgi:hypothetical protein